MASYRGSHREDRAKAIAGVALVHVALGAVILSGLNVDTVTRAVERLRTFDITPEAPPPPLEEPPPLPEESSAPKDEAAPANVKSKPTPVVAPTPRIPPPIPLPINTSDVRGPEGLDRTAGASNVRGVGTGAGGYGSGFGGGGRGGTGAGNGGGKTPAAVIRKIPHSQYRRIASGRIHNGTAGVTLLIAPNGRVSNCRVARSSGDPVVDANLCAVAVEHMRFRPARDENGRAIWSDLTYYPRWWLPRGSF